MIGAHRRAWTPSLGAWRESGGVVFRVWAPHHAQVDVVIDRPPAPIVHPLGRDRDGFFSAVVSDVHTGDRYRYRLDGDRLFPDPASRYQPDGVHGASQIVDPHSFPWTDRRWAGLEIADAVFYELHVGTFSAEGTFAGVAARLPELAELGITAGELMPIADFPGSRNWGYDGAALFAPARCYGPPDDLRRLVDRAHALGMAVFLDVVYNHLGPDGAYLLTFSPHYLTERHQTPWGAGLNFDGEFSQMVRGFFIENALHWVHEYHLDGLRLDATHAIADESPRHLLAELSARVRESVPDRRVLVVAEDHRNLNVMLQPESRDGWGLDAVWSDDFHHECRRLLAGDCEGYYEDYRGDIRDLATAIRQGWLYTGQFSKHLHGPRGTDPVGLSLNRFIVCLQNHDQIGNRALGERLNHQIDVSAYRAASAVLLTAPETPLLFMGQEWAASTPFLYFTDHEAELGRRVTAGRRQEFRHFSTFADPDARARIPDPQALATFQRSRLEWAERRDEPHASMLRLHRALLTLRQDLHRRGTRRCRITTLDDSTIAIERIGPEVAYLVVARLRGSGTVSWGSDDSLPAGHLALSDRSWTIALTTEDAAFCGDPTTPRVHVRENEVIIHFLRPSAIVLHRSLGDRPRFQGAGHHVSDQ
jgi:maltooligosyltrehalose trehalohydrolase